jgi:hypothetical protein
MVIRWTWNVSPRIGLRGLRKLPEVHTIPAMKQLTTSFMRSTGSEVAAARGRKRWE